MHPCIQRLARVRAATLARLADATETELTDQPFDYPWSVNDILRHLAFFDVHLTAELSDVADDQGQAHSFADVKESPMPREVFTQTRAFMTAWLADLPAERLAVRLPRSTHPLLVGRTASEAIDFCAFHERRHAEEIGRHLAATRYNRGARRSADA